MIKGIKNIILKIIYILLIIYISIFIPKLWGQNPLVIISGSMEPTLHVGGILYYQEKNIDEYEIGDVLVYKTEAHNISHRIVEQEDECFITKGDANNTYDKELVCQDTILGKGTNWSIPYIGYYADYIYSHKYLIYISIVLISLDLVFDKKKEVKTNEKSN